MLRGSDLLKEHMVSILLIHCFAIVSTSWLADWHKEVSGMDAGLILFSKRSKKRSLLSLQKPIRNSPSKEFLDKTSEVNIEKLPIQSGITLGVVADVQ